MLPPSLPLSLPACWITLSFLSSCNQTWPSPLLRLLQHSVGCRTSNEALYRIRILFPPPVQHANPPPLCCILLYLSLSLSLSGLYSLPLLFCLLPLFSLCPSSSLSPFLVLFIFADLTKDKVTGEFSILCICSPKGLSRSLAVCLHHSPQHRVFTCVFTH